MYISLSFSCCCLFTALPLPLSWLLGLSVPKQAFLTWLSRSLLLPTASDLLKGPCFLKGKGETALLLQTHRRNVVKGPSRLSSSITRPTITMRRDFYSSSVQSYQVAHFELFSFILHV